MTTVAQAPQQGSAKVVLEKAVIKSWKTPVAFGVVTLVSFALFVGLGRPGVSQFRLTSERNLIQLPVIDLPSMLTCIVITVLLAAITLVAAYLVSQGRTAPIWLIAVFGFLFMVALLTWAGAGASIPVYGLLLGTVALSAPLIFGALGGVICERSGVVNIAIEGQMLAGAFVSAMIATLTKSPFLGLIGAMVAGMLVSSVLATFAIKYVVDQIIVGVVLNVLVTGLTSFLYSTVMTANPQMLNSPPRFQRIEIPVLSEIPIIGPLLFQQTIIIYLMYVTIAVVWFGLYRTRWGLRVRAVGEHPQAADTVGIKVGVTRFWNVSLGGAVAGMGGAYFTLGSVGAFNKEMTAGAGFIALAAVIFGQWDPLKATLAALLFGFATNLQGVLGIIGSPVPSEFMLMLPYVVTILAVAGFVGKSRAPAADGKAYIK